MEYQRVTLELKRCREEAETLRKRLVEIETRCRCNAEIEWQRAKEEHELLQQVQ